MNSTDKVYTFKGVRVEENSNEGNNGNNNGSNKTIYFSILANGRTYAYTHNVSNSKHDVLNNGSAYEVLVFDGNSAENNYGSYNGANHIFTYYSQGAGTYTIVPDNTDFIAKPNTKSMIVALTIGNGNSTGSRRYEIKSGIATVTVINNKTHITIKNPVIAESLFGIGDASGIAETVSLTTNDVYSHE